MKNVSSVAHLRENKRFNRLFRREDKSDIWRRSLFACSGSLDFDFMISFRKVTKLHVFKDLKLVVHSLQISNKK